MYLLINIKMCMKYSYRMCVLYPTLTRRPDSFLSHVTNKESPCLVILDYTYRISPAVKVANQKKDSVLIYKRLTG